MCTHWASSPARWAAAVTRRWTLSNRISIEICDGHNGVVERGLELRNLSGNVLPGLLFLRSARQIVPSFAFLAGDGATRALTCSSVRVGALSSNRQA